MPAQPSSAHREKYSIGQADQAHLKRRQDYVPVIVNREAHSDRTWSQRRNVPESPTLRMLAQKPGSIDRILRYNDGHTSMIPGRIGCELAVVTVLCVLMIFFFPLLQGPYSVVNGPATALQAPRAE